MNTNKDVNLFNTPLIRPLATFPLQVEGTAHNLAPDAQHALLGECAGIQLENFLDEGAFSLRYKSGGSGCMLDFTHLVYTGCTLLKQLHQLRVDAVNLVSQLVQSHTRARIVSYWRRGFNPDFELRRKCARKRLEKGVHDRRICLTRGVARV